MKPIILLSLALCSVALSDYWKLEDSQRLAKVFQNSLATKSKLSALHYAASGLKLLNIEPNPAAAKAACEVVKKADIKNLDNLYHVSSLSVDLPNCALSSLAGIKGTIDATIADSSSTPALLYKALVAAEKLSIKVDKAAFDVALGKALKDNLPVSLIGAISAASHLDKTAGAKYFEKVATLVGQADLHDSKYLQFEQGFSVTAQAVSSIFEVSSQQGKAPGVTQEQVLHFANYLISRKHISTEREAFYLLKALGHLSNNQYLVPVSVSLNDNGVADVGKSVRIHVSNIFGLPIVASSVKAQSVSQKKTDVASNVVLSKVGTDGLIYELPLTKVPSPGVYTATIAVEAQDKRLVGLTGNSVTVKVVRDITVENVKVGLLKKDESASEKNVHSVVQFSKLEKHLESDHSNRIFISIALKSKSGGSVVSAHQVFVIFSHQNGHEVVFVADPQGSGAYSLDIDLAKNHKDFEGVSGKYSARLVVGDSFFKNPIDWTFADITLTIPAAPVVLIPKSEEIVYQPLKDIEHMFREPEKRPAALVSLIFTGVCIAPLGLLFVLWFKIGINFGAMPTNIWVPIFHVGLAGLFGLYFLFWLQLDMFETLKYIGIVGTVTFIAGNRLLRSIADRRKSKTD